MLAARKLGTGTNLMTDAEGEIGLPRLCQVSKGSRSPWSLTVCYV